MEYKTKKAIDVFKRIILTVFVILVILTIAFFVFKKLGILNLTKEELRDKISSTGAWCQIIFIIVSFLQVTFIPIPGAVTILTGSLMFGVWKSFLYSFVGMFLGSLFAFYLGKKFGRPLVNWIAGDKELVEHYLEKSKGKEGVVFFFMFLLPMFPDDLLCSIAGITKITWKEFIAMQIVCKPIGIIATLFFMSGEFIPYHGWGLVVLITIAILSIVAFIICYKNADAINEWFNKLFDKITFKKNKK